MTQWVDRKLNQEAMDPLSQDILKYPIKKRTTIIWTWYRWTTFIPTLISASGSIVTQSQIRISRMESFTLNLTSPGNALLKKNWKMSCLNPSELVNYKLDLLLTSNTNTKTTNLNPRSRLPTLRFSTFMEQHILFIWLQNQLNNQNSSRIKYLPHNSQKVTESNIYLVIAKCALAENRNLTVQSR